MPARRRAAAAEDPAAADARLEDARWTTLLLAPFRGVRWHDAFSGPEDACRRLRVQMHPTDEQRLLVRLGAGPLPREDDELQVVFGRTSRAALVVRHVQCVPSWKGDVRAAVITFD